MRFVAQISDRLRHWSERRTLTPERALARRGEDLAQRFLQKRGYRVVARNYRPYEGSGEIDLIAWHGEVLVFVEVKTRSGDEAGTPERAVTPEKQRRLIRTASAYTRAAKANPEMIRFDIVAVLDQKRPRVELFADAFRPAPRLY